MKTVLSESRRFTFDERIKRASEFKNLFKNGKRVSVVGAKLFYLPNNLKFNRIGFPLPRGFGNAVERNRAKRFSREIFRNLKSYLNTGYDMLFLVYPPAEKDAKFRCKIFGFFYKSLQALYFATISEML